MTARRWAVVCAAGAIAFVAGGCGDTQSSTFTTAPVTTPAASSSAAIPATTSSSAPTTSSTTVVPTTAACPAFTQTDVTSDGFPGRLSGLVGADVRTGTGLCSERFVLELQGTGTFPGWHVRYEPAPLTDDPRGEPVDVAGAAFIVVTVESWMTNMEGDGYHGPTRITPTNVANITELVMLGSYESVTTWAIGVDQQRPFEVSVLNNPPRLVIDIASS